MTDPRDDQQPHGSEPSDPAPGQEQGPPEDFKLIDFGRILRWMLLILGIMLLLVLILAGILALRG